MQSQTNASNSSTATTTATAVPFGSSDVLDDTLVHVLGFLIVLVAAHPLGMLFPRFMKLPFITGYLIVGILTLLIIAIFLIPGGPNHHEVFTATNCVDDDDDVAVLSSEQTQRMNASTPQWCGAALIGSLYFKGFLWLFMGYTFNIFTNIICEITTTSFGHVWDIKFEPLLVLMVGSCLAGHYSKIRHGMHVILDASAPFIFLPFFVLIGASLELDQVVKAIPLMSLFVGLRYTSIIIATYCAGRWILKLPPHQYKNLLLTMTPQAGVALGLANEVKSFTKEPWAAEFAATIVAAVVVNQILGPVLCSMGLRRAGECDGGIQKQRGWSVHEEGAFESGHGRPADTRGGGGVAGGWIEHPASVRRAVVIGDDEMACELALQLALHAQTSPCLCWTMTRLTDGTR